MFPTSRPGSNEYVWVGLSTDTKPTDAWAGQMCKESDTGSTFEWSGTKWTRDSLNGAGRTFIDQVNHTPSMEYFHRHTGVISTLSVATVGDGSENTITVVNGALFAVNDHIQIGTEATLPKILAIATNVLTLDRYIDNQLNVGVSVEVVTRDMNVIGSLAVPISFKWTPDTGEIHQVMRMFFSMAHNTAGDMGLFGNLTALVNGVIIRCFVNGKYHTLTNWKTNSEIKDDFFDVDFDVRSGGQGNYGTALRGTLSNMGISIRLDGNAGDFIEVLIQDNLSSLNSFRMKAQGYIENA